MGQKSQKKCWKKFAQGAKVGSIKHDQRSSSEKKLKGPGGGGGRLQLNFVHHDEKNVLLNFIGDEPFFYSFYLRGFMQGGDSSRVFKLTLILPGGGGFRSPFYIFS